MLKNLLEILLFNILIDSSSLSPQRLRVTMNKILPNYIQHKLSQHTSFFGIKLWILITALSTSIAFLFVLFFFLCFIFHRRRTCRQQQPFRLRSKLCLPLNDKGQNRYNRCGLEDVESQRISQVGWSSSRLSYYYTRSFSSSTTGGFASFTLFTFKEIHNVTDGFADENVIAKGDSSVVYRGLLMGSVSVAVKRFFPILQRHEDNDFITRVEVIANVRHKNVMRLLGYCIDGYERVLVYEYAEKGDLHEWLHGSSGRNRPLSWRKRMKIIQGVAKGLAYFHEDIEPRITHQCIRPSKILLDYQWNPKIILSIPGDGDIPLNSNFVPSPGNMDEKIDVHGFGTLIMELVSGRLDIDQDSPHVYLVDWIKEMVANRMIVDVLDPNLPAELPTVKELKRIVLIALRCVDPEVEQRPKMGDVTHMLQPHDLLLSDNVIQKPRKITRSHEVSAISIRT